MPTILRIGPYSFHFYSDERNEPHHIHVASGAGECKFWLSPVRLAKNRGLPAHELRRIEQMIYKHQMQLMEKYEQYHHS